MLRHIFLVDTSSFVASSFCPFDMFSSWLDHKSLQQKIEHNSWVLSTISTWQHQKFALPFQTVNFFFVFTRYFSDCNLNILSLSCLKLWICSWWCLIAVIYRKFFNGIFIHLKNSLYSFYYCVRVFHDPKHRFKEDAFCFHDGTKTARFFEQIKQSISSLSTEKTSIASLLKRKKSILFLVSRFLCCFFFSLSLNI